MVLIEVFDKRIKKTDIDYRLSFRTQHLNLLPFVGGSREAEFQVSPLGDEERCWTFRCIKRNGSAAKPVIARGWSEVVRENDLQVGDRLKFYVDNEDGHPPQYRIMVERHGTLLMGAIIPNPDGNWHRIV